jgi:hypothetical protein
MATAIPDIGGGKLITFLYHEDSVIMFDNPVQAWIIDETGATPAKPIILGELPPAAGDTGDIESPQWAQFVGNAVYIPDKLRTSVAGLFTYLATNNGAHRKLWPEFMDPTLNGFYNQWREGNPDLANAYNPAEPAPEGEAVSAFTRTVYGEPHHQVIPDGARVPPPPEVSLRPADTRMAGQDVSTTTREGRQGDAPGTVQANRDALDTQTKVATGMAQREPTKGEAENRAAQERDTKGDHDTKHDTKAPTPAPGSKK